MEIGNTFLDTNYVTIPIEQYEDLLNTARDVHIIKKLIISRKYMSITELCTILSIPEPPVPRYGGEDDVDNG